MTHSLIVVDDFHPDPVALRAAVVASEFKTEFGPDGFPYTGISTYHDPVVLEQIAGLMQRAIRSHLAVWRVNYEGELPNTYVHSDGICAGWAGLLYLNTPEQCAANPSGTAFYDHKILRIGDMPTDEQIVAMGAEPAEFKRLMEADWHLPDRWDATDVVRMKFNRFVAYPTSRFHSRYPHAAFGRTPADGRLLLTCFFDLV